MVQTRVTESFPQRRSTRTLEKRKLPRTRSTKEGIEEEEEGKPLLKISGNHLETFRKALDTSSPAHLPGREAQIYEVKEFIMEHLAGKKPGSLYISGAPGTGKTAVVRFVLDEIEREREALKEKDQRKKLGFYSLFINCMCKSSATQVYDLILEKLPKTRATSQNKFGSSRDRVQDRIFVKSSNANMIVIVLDEMDQILKGSNEVLYSLFEWARSPQSKLILIGIANALDLTVRHLPFLHLNASPQKEERGLDGKPLQPLQTMCRTMSFPPYRREDIELIIQERMSQVGHNIFNASAIKFVAAKVAASTGDARKALHACKEAMVNVEKQEQRNANVSLSDSTSYAPDENVLNTSTTSSAPSTPKKVCIRHDQIGIGAVSKVLQVRKDDGPLPIQQTTILAALLKIQREAPGTKEPLVDGVNKPIPVSTLYKHYRKICSLKGFSWLEESELPLVCEVLQDRSLLTLVNSGTSGGKKLSMGSKKFGSPSSSASARNKIGVFFQPQVIEGIVLKGDLKTIFNFASDD